jgi:hypothetical protein
MPWSARSTIRSRCPDGRTLRDAASYIMVLPAKAKNAPEWQAAAEAVLACFDLSGLI